MYFCLYGSETSASQSTVERFEHEQLITDHSKALGLLRFSFARFGVTFYVVSSCVSTLF